MHAQLSPGRQRVLLPGALAVLPKSRHQPRQFEVVALHLAVLPKAPSSQGVKASRALGVAPTPRFPRPYGISLARPASRALESPLTGVAAEVPTIVVPSTVVQNEFGRVFDRAMAGTDVAIAKHSVIRAFLVSAERYLELMGHQTVDLDALSSRLEQLYASMQSSAVRSATSRALRATPEEMGKAAVAAARRGRIVVIAGVNGAGKSSVVGASIREARGAYFNPDEETM